MTDPVDEFVNQPPGDPVPPAVRQAWNEGRQVDAIRQLRAAHPALSLRDAQDWLEGRAPATAMARTSAWQPGQPLPADVLAALQAQQPVEAIRRMRAASGLGLKEAQALIEGDQGPSLPATALGGAPGEQAPSRWTWPLALVLGLGALAWWLVG